MYLVSAILYSKKCIIHPCVYFGYVCYCYCRRPQAFKVRTVHQYFNFSLCLVLCQYTYNKCFYGKGDVLCYRCLTYHVYTRYTMHTFHVLCTCLQFLQRMYVTDNYVYVYDMQTYNTVFLSYISRTYIIWDLRSFNFRFADTYNGCITISCRKGVTSDDIIH